MKPDRQTRDFCLRGIPADLYLALRIQAAEADMSMNAYLLLALAALAQVGKREVAK